MRLITRADVDGLACAVFLSMVEKIDDIEFAHPKDVQDGLVDVTGDDILANLPYHPGCGLWFDHHASERVTVGDGAGVKGKFGEAPSAARLVFEHYGAERFRGFEDFLDAVDRFDSAQLTEHDVLEPEGWILVSFTLDPRSGLGKYRQYFRGMIDWVRTKTLSEVLALPEVQGRCRELRESRDQMLELLRAHSRLEGTVIVTDLRSLGERPMGNRFLVFTLFPQAEVEARIFHGRSPDVTVVALGKSIFRRTCSVNLGELLMVYGGGGHEGAATVQFDAADAEARIAEILATLQRGSSA